MISGTQSNSSGIVISDEDGVIVVPLDRLDAVMRPPLVKKAEAISRRR